LVTVLSDTAVSVKFVRSLPDHVARTESVSARTQSVHAILGFHHLLMLLLDLARCRVDLLILLGELEEIGITFGESPYESGGLQRQQHRGMF
jgi:hypothetical protein